MMKDYKIDIFQNEISGFKGLKIFAIIFSLLFLCMGIFLIVQAYHKHSNWAAYLTSLNSFAMAVIIYFMATGKWIYKRYLIINSEKVIWTRSKLLGTTMLPWSEINKIRFEYSSIQFELKNGKKKNFSLTNITMPQISELKSIISEISVSKGVNYHSM